MEGAAAPILNGRNQSEQREFTNLPSQTPEEEKFGRFN
jgi:hypothetical protein